MKFICEIGGRGHFHGETNGVPSLKLLPIGSVLRGLMQSLQKAEVHSRGVQHALTMKDWCLIAAQPAPAPHRAHPEGPDVVPEEG